MSLVAREKNLCLGVDPFWSYLAMGVTQDIALRNYFSKRIILGEEYLPVDGALILAPTHRSRWDALMLTMAAGRRVTKRDCRFMVTRSEMKGIQGWFLSRLGCFPIDQEKPSLVSLRYSVDLLINGEQLVVFPEGKINRNSEPLPLEQGLVRLAQLALRCGIQVKIIPVGLGYSQIVPKPFGLASICFEKPLIIEKFGKQSVNEFNAKLSERMHAAEEAALKAVGRE